MDYEKILKRCLEKVPNDIDAREGSFIHTAIAPICLELSNAYFEMQNMVDLSFLETSHGEFLDKMVFSMGIIRFEAIKCQKKAKIVTTSNIIGEKFSCGDYIFEVIKNIDEDIFLIQAMEYGDQFNNIFGELRSILNIKDIVSAKIIENYILSSKSETDEELRIRAKNKIFAKPFAGNISSYNEEIRNISGVIYSKVFTAVDMGIGNVHIVIGGVNKTPVSQEICQNCEEIFNGLHNQVGIAPIGHNVSISSCEFKQVSIYCQISIDNIKNKMLTMENAKKAVTDYVNSLNFENGTISSIKAMASILQVSGILDINNFKMNQYDGNLILSKEYNMFEIPQINNIDIVVI